MKVVVAYSGGLDTSVAIHWLQENYNLDVIAIAINVGQEPSKDDIVARALRNGAIKSEFLDATDEFVSDYIWPALKANALYQDNIGLSILIEVILTFVFVIAILGVTSKTENSAVAGLVIGLTLTLVHILGIALTGTSVNPARSIGSAVFAGGEALKNVWVFIVAPLAGGALAAIVYKFLSKEEK